VKAKFFTILPAEDIPLSLIKVSYNYLVILHIGARIAQSIIFAIYLFVFCIPWIFWGKPPLDIGIVNIDRNALHNMYIQL
jgi:hypothetical protein